MPRSPTESYYALRASRALERAFQPITSEALARYIFSPTPRIPSKAFASSLVLHITHRLTHSGLSDPRRAFLLPSASFAPRTESATVHLVLTPLKYVSGALVGIISAEGATPDGEIMPFAEALNNGIKRGRFVFDVKRQQMVSILDDMGPDALGVVTTNWIDATRHERVFFAIPKQQYSFDRMPRKAMIVLTNLEYQISKIHHNERLQRMAVTPDNMFNESESLPGNMSNNVQKADTFDLSMMTEAIEDIARSMSGVYYGPNLKRDVINTTTGELSSRASGKMVCRLGIPDYVGQCKIRRMVAQDYFLKLLPPGSERWFMQNEFSANLSLLSDDATNENHREAWDEEDRGITLDPVALAELDAFEAIIPEGDVMQYVVPNHVSKSTNVSSTSTGAPPLLGDMIPPYGQAAPATAPISSDVAMQATQTEVDEDDAKKRKGEERRIRNRLSAARSNEKRKKREKEQKMELETLRERIPILETVRQRLVDENDMLRKLAEGVL